MAFVLWLRLAVLTVLLAWLYLSGISPIAVVVMAVFFTLLIVYRSALWARADSFVLRFSFLSGKPAWVRWLAVFVVFMAVYYLFKIVVFWVLAALGIDVLGQMSAALNASS